MTPLALTLIGTGVLFIAAGIQGKDPRTMLVDLFTPVAPATQASNGRSGLPDPKTGKGGGTVGGGLGGGGGSDW